MEAVAGATAMDVRVALVTVSAAGRLVIGPSVAVIEVFPGAIPVANPCVPAELLIFATAGVLDAHVTVEVSTLVVPSAYVPVAVNCWVLPAEMVGLDGVIVIDCSVAVGGGVEPPELPPQPTNKLTPSNRNASSNRFIRTPPGRSRPQLI